MPDSPALGTLSDYLVVAAILVYTLAMLSYAAEYAFGSRGRIGRTVTARAGSTAARTHERIDAPALVGATAGGRRPAPYRAWDGARTAPPEHPAEVRPAEPAAPTAGFGPAGALGRVAVALTVLGWAVHAGSLLARGLSAGRVPWGNMYEFSSSVALMAVTAFLVLLTRQPVRYLGAFVLLPVVLYLGLAATVLYVDPEPLVPALNSYWLKIHVTAAVLSTGVFLVAGVSTALYLLRSAYERRSAVGAAPRFVGLGRILPASAALDRTAYRLTAFAFPIWTFAVIAGAIWAEAAWGRYWGWDPKETWAFISWVLYAGYLHARATAGWKGGRAAALALVAFASMLINYFGVNLWIVGLHSYAF